MIAYLFYWLEEIDKVHFVGLLPERRNTQERITQQSILNHARAILGNRADVDNLFFIEITLDESAGQILWADPSIRLTHADA